MMRSEKNLCPLRLVLLNREADVCVAASTLRAGAASASPRGVAVFGFSGEELLFILGLCMGVPITAGLWLVLLGALRVGPGQVLHETSACESLMFACSAPKEKPFSTDPGQKAAGL